jgi:hypothetical protein
MSRKSKYLSFQVSTRTHTYAMGNEQSGAAGAGAGAGAGASAVSSPLPSNSNVSSPPPQQGTVLPKGVKRMPPDLQKKFATAGSVQNMRILIRGASGTGKSALFARLEGGPFLDVLCCCESKRDECAESVKC